MNLINASACELFNLPFFQFAQMKKFCPEEIPRIKADYKAHWENWKATILQASTELGAPFAKPHIESWTNGWQVRARNSPTCFRRSTPDTRAVAAPSTPTPSPMFPPGWKPSPRSADWVARPVTRNSPRPCDWCCTCVAAPTGNAGWRRWGRSGGARMGWSGSCPP